MRSRSRYVDADLAVRIRSLPGTGLAGEAGARARIAEGAHDGRRTAHRRVGRRICGAAAVQVPHLGAVAVHEVRIGNTAVEAVVGWPACELDRPLRWSGTGEEERQHDLGAPKDGVLLVREYFLLSLALSVFFLFFL